MFKVSFFVEDAKLGEAFKRLAGVARNVEHAYVPNVEPAANGKTNISAADAMDLIGKCLRKHKADSFQGPYMKKILEELGMPTSSYSHRIGQLIEHGIIKAGKKEGATTTYHLVK